jgi:hypothetical protein
MAGVDRAAEVSVFLPDYCSGVFPSGRRGCARFRSDLSRRDVDRIGARNFRFPDCYAAMGSVRCFAMETNLGVSGTLRVATGVRRD